MMRSPRSADRLRRSAALVATRVNIFTRYGGTSPFIALNDKTPILKSIRCLIGSQCRSFRCTGTTLPRFNTPPKQQCSGLSVNAVCHITAVPPIASCSGPGVMTRTHAEESVDRPILWIIARCAVASAESSTIDIRLRRAVRGQIDCRRTRPDYVHHWLVELLHRRREKQALTKFLDIALCTITYTRSFRSSALVYLTSSIHRALRHMHQKHR